MLRIIPEFLGKFSSHAHAKLDRRLQRRNIRPIRHPKNDRILPDHTDNILLQSRIFHLLKHKAVKCCLIRRNHMDRHSHLNTLLCLCVADLILRTVISG